MQLLEKIQELREWFSKGRADAQDVAVIDGWMDEAKRLFLLKSLKDHDGIRYLLEIYQADIRKINEKLLSSDSKTLPDTERDRLLDRRDLAQKYLDLFLPVDSAIDELEKKVADA